MKLKLLVRAKNLYFGVFDDAVHEYDIEKSFR